MKFLSGILRQSATARRVVAASVLAGFALAFALAVSPELHERVHHDADQSQHHCLAVLLHAGSLHDAPVAAMSPAQVPVDFAALLFSPSREAGSVFLSSAILEHAPPAALLS